MKKAKKIFEKKLSGEPLYQDAVIEAIQLAQRNAIKSTAKLAKKTYTNWYFESNGVISPMEFSKLTIEIIEQLTLKIK